MNTADALNSFLRTEHAAAASYRLALPVFGEGTPARASIEECLRVHEQNAAKLARRVRDLGAKPTTHSDAWGTVITLLERVAAKIGPAAAIAVLEEGEDRGLRRYTHELPQELDPAARDLVVSELLPAQERAHRTMSGLKSAISA